MNPYQQSGTNQSKAWDNAILKDIGQLDQLRQDTSSSLESINKSLLPGRVKLWCLKFSLLPQLIWPLTIYAVPISKVGMLERMISSYASKWLGLPRCFSKMGLYRKGILERSHFQSNRGIQMHQSQAWDNAERIPWSICRSSCSHPDNWEKMDCMCCYTTFQASPQALGCHWPCAKRQRGPSLPEVRPLCYRVTPSQQQYVVLEMHRPYVPPLFIKSEAHSNQLQDEYYTRLSSHSVVAREIFNEGLYKPVSKKVVTLCKV